MPTTLLVVQLTGGALVFQNDALVSSWNFQQAAIVFISSCLQLPLFHSCQLMHMYGRQTGGNNSNSHMKWTVASNGKTKVLVIMASLSTITWLSEYITVTMVQSESLHVVHWALRYVDYLLPTRSVCIPFTPRFHIVNVFCPQNGKWADPKLDNIIIAWSLSPVLCICALWPDSCFCHPCIPHMEDLRTGVKRIQANLRHLACVCDILLCSYNPF